MKKHTEVTQELINAIKSNDFTVHQLQEKFGVSKSTIYNVANKEKCKLYNPKDTVHYVGKVFGRLTVLDVIKRSSPKSDKKITTHYKCICVCGNEKIVSKASLIGKHTQSCGCLFKESVGANPLPDGLSMFNQVFRNYKSGAARRNLEFTITEEEFKKLTKENCYYCGCEPSKQATHPKSPSIYIYNGVDRVDNNKGYVNDNVVTCCEQCNIAKRFYSQSDFFVWVQKVYNLHENRFYKN